MFRTVPLSIIRTFLLYTQQWYMSYRFAGSLMSANLYVLLCVQWKTPDDGQMNCPKHVEFYSKNKFEKLVHVVGFIIRILQFLANPSPRQSTKLSTPAFWASWPVAYHRLQKDKISEELVSCKNIYLRMRSDTKVEYLAPINCLPFMYFHFYTKSDCGPLKPKHV